jgi:4'-phosphopantetheinyl transferase
MCRFRKEDDRQIFAASHIATRLLLSHYLQCSPESIIYQKNEFGKPHIAFPETTIHFNLSHSGSQTLIAIAKQPIGIDIEKIDSKINSELLMKRFFSKQESQHFLSLPLSEKTTHFYRLWTQKEALAKALGESVYKILNTTSFDLPLKSDRHIIQVNQQSWSIENFELHPNFMAAICFEALSEHNRLLNFSFDCNYTLRE